MSGTPAGLGVGMLGYGFMGKAHAHAYRSVAHLTSPPTAPRLVAVAGRTAGSVEAAAARFGFERSTTDWQDLVSDPAIALFDNAGPNSLHAEPTLAAAQAGKHLLCEKPLGLDASESHAIWRAAEDAGVVHMCGFNYRFLPAVGLARELILGGEIGEVHRFRCSYLQDWLADASAPHVWRLDRSQAGAGALGDLGTHAIDLARFLVGEIATVSGRLSTVVPERPGGTVTVDDSFEALVEFEAGATGSISASRLCHGRRNGLTFEVNGSEGSVAFDVERLNELRVFVASSQPATSAQGFRRVLATDPGHPHLEHWWPPGHGVGWGDSFIHEIDHLLRAIAGERDVAPLGATFEDGYRAAEVCGAIVRSSEGGAREPVRYRRK
jgi:predicted dehydrogenase